MAPFGELNKHGTASFMDRGTLRMRHTQILLAGLFLPVAQAVAQPMAQPFPTRPMRMVIPFPPGGGLDVLVRMINQPLSEAMGQPIIADNRPAIDGIAAEETVARAQPDGHTLLSVASSHAINPALGRKLPYDTTRDFMPITQLATQPLLLIVNPAFSAKSVRDVIDLAKKASNGLSYGTSSSATHLPMELFSAMAGIKMLHVPYRGAPPVINDIIGGQIQLCFCASSSVMPLVRAGRLAALATGDSKRSAILPDVPTVAEAGVPGYYAAIWSAMLAPAKTPPAIIEKLNHEVTRILNAPDMRNRMLNQLGLEPTPSTPEALGLFIRNEIAKWSKIARLAGVKSPG